MSLTLKYKVSKGKKKILIDLTPGPFACICSFLPLTSLVSVAGLSHAFWGQLVNDNDFWVAF
ncbi:hypothetical protein PM082_004480 [Marasmius tenuissimus]|nr:hypothetical protein PM082_004480 [Marasmius tenuissimus]